MSTLDTLKQQVFEANLELPRRGLVTYTWGNVSAVDETRQFVVIKPSGVAYETMQVDDMVVVDMEGQVVEGERRPSSDLATHLVLYRAFPACRAVAHTHSRKAAAWAQAERDIPVLGTTHSDYFYGPVPCTRRMTPDEISSGYERETGTVITETFTRRGIDPAAVPGVLVACHGPFTWGTSPQDAVHNSVVLEELAAMALDTLLLNGSGEPFQQELLDKHFLRKHGKHAYYGQR